ncbi:MAG TPA: nitroreductase family protein [Desulfatiglandales bacterium]|nr:nitroreductase family protein [Desulfatiglandales bacterium]
MIEDLVRRTRSCRRFREEPIGEGILSSLVDLARLSASAANLQPLKYLLSCEKEMNEVIFPELKWAGYMKDWDGPVEGERPSAYIIVLGDREIAESFGCDHGIASQNILLGATDMGLGGCIIASVNRDNLRKAFRIPDRFEILHVIALGRPGERIVMEEIGESGDIKYWRDGSGIHHVPKRALDDIIIKVDSRDKKQPNQ